MAKQSNVNLSGDDIRRVRARSDRPSEFAAADDPRPPGCRQNDVAAHDGHDAAGDNSFLINVVDVLGGAGKPIEAEHRHLVDDVARLARQVFRPDVEPLSLGVRLLQRCAPSIGGAEMPPGAELLDPAPSLGGDTHGTACQSPWPAAAWSTRPFRLYLAWFGPDLSPVEATACSAARIWTCEWAAANFAAPDSHAPPRPDQPQPTECGTRPRQSRLALFWVDSTDLIVSICPMFASVDLIDSRIFVRSVYAHMRVVVMASCYVIRIRTAVCT